MVEVLSDQVFSNGGMHVVNDQNPRSSSIYLGCNVRGKIKLTVTPRRIHLDYLFPVSKWIMSVRHSGLGQSHGLPGDMQAMDLGMLQKGLSCRPIDKRYVCNTLARP